jgi:uroporphyrinogen-III synthase
VTRALITRPAEDAAPLAEALRARGIEPLIDPMLRIETIEGAPVPLDGVQAILFTSTNGVRAFAARELRRDLPAYAVGDATASAARQAGFADVKSAAGDSAALARLVADERDPKKGALLHARGSHVAGDLAGALQGAGFEVRAAELYRADPAEALADETRRALAEGALDFAVFFSPHTAETFVALARAAGLADAVAPVTAVCLSQAVADAAAPLPWRSVAVAERPTQGALLATLDARLPAQAETKMDEAPPRATPPRPSRAPLTIAAIAAIVALAGAAAGTYPFWRGAVGLGAGEAASSLRLEKLESDFAALKSDIAKRQDETAGRIAANAKALDDASNKLAMLADAQSRLLQGAGNASDLAARVETLAKKLDELEASIGTLAGQGGQIAPLADAVKALEPRIAEIEKAQQAQKSEAAGTQRGAGLVVAAAALAEAVRTGQPYATPLATVAALAKDDSDIQHQLATLLPGARTGIATEAALAARFPKVADEVARAAIAPEGASWTDRVLARLASLITVRRTGAGAKGDSAQAIVARAETDLKVGDLAGAVDEVTKLAGAPAEAVAGWLADARARRDALRATKALSDLAIQTYLHPAGPLAPQATAPAPAANPPK